MRTFTLWLVLSLIILAVGWYWYEYQRNPSAAPSSTATSTAQSADVSAVTSVVQQFGAQEQKVSLMASNASTTIASTYAPYVVPALLAQWEANPQNAPGRVVSSPWPDHINVDSITQDATGYHVNADLIMMTSDNVEHGGNAGDVPITLELVQQNGAWLISSYQGVSQS